MVSTPRGPRLSLEEPKPAALTGTPCALTPGEKLEKLLGPATEFADNVPKAGKNLRDVNQRP